MRGLPRESKLRTGAEESKTEDDRGGGKYVGRRWDEGGSGGRRYTRGAPAELAAKWKMGTRVGWGCSGSEGQTEVKAAGVRPKRGETDSEN